MPYNPTVGFDDEVIDLAKRGREIVQKAADASPAAAQDLRMPYTLTETKIRGEGCSFDPLYRPFYDAVTAYKTRWGAEMHHANMQLARSKGKGEGKAIEFAGYCEEQQGALGVIGLRGQVRDRGKTIDQPDERSVELMKKRNPAPAFGRNSIKFVAIRTGVRAEEV